MSKHLVFLVHGMGQHYNKGEGQDVQEGWSDAGIAALKKGATALGYAGTFKDDYEFIPISYSGVFDKYFEAHKKEAEKFYDNPSTALIKQVSTKYPFIGALMKFAKKKPNTKNFMTSHFSDVALYAASHLGGQVREKVRNEILQGLVDHGAKSSWSIISHSLGTRVTHDLLQNIYSKPDNYSVYGRPNMLMAIGNVIELMHPGKRANLYKNTRVFPSNKKQTGSCYYYVNGCHPLDPFTWLRHFDPLSTWGKGQQTDDRFLDAQMRNSHVTQFNTHGFDHYLSHPRLQACFFKATRKLSPAYPISDSKLSKAITKYEENCIKGKLQEFRNEIEAIKVTKLDDWNELAESLVKYKKLIKKFTG